MGSSQELFDEIVALTGVSIVLAPGLVTRSLADAGVSVENATLDHYEEALPRLTARMRAYLPEEQAAERAQAILARIVSLRGTPAKHTPLGLTRHRIKAQIAARPTPATGARSALRESGEHAPAAPNAPVHEAYEDDDYTLVGRRWTADERAVIDTHKSGKK